MTRWDAPLIVPTPFLPRVRGRKEEELRAVRTTIVRNLRRSRKFFSDQDSVTEESLAPSMPSAQRPPKPCPRDF
jgi:hypothetical protein